MSKFSAADQFACRLLRFSASHSPREDTRTRNQTVVVSIELAGSAVFEINLPHSTATSLKLITRVTETMYISSICVIYFNIIFNITASRTFTFITLLNSIRTTVSFFRMTMCQKSKRRILCPLPSFLPYPRRRTTGISGSPCRRRRSRYSGPISIRCATTGRPDDESCGLSSRVQQGSFPHGRAVTLSAHVSSLRTRNLVTGKCGDLVRAEAESK